MADDAFCQRDRDATVELDAPFGAAKARQVGNMTWWDRYSDIHTLMISEHV